MTTLVTPREVIDLAFADGGYLPPEAIGTVDIAAAEARYLLPVTGPALWQKLAEGEYPTLREEFAAPAAERFFRQPLAEDQAVGAPDHAGHQGQRQPFLGVAQFFLFTQAGEVGHCRRPLGCGG